MSNSLTAVVTGAARGIGLELCRQLSNKGYTVYGLCRTVSDELGTVNGVKVIEGIDVTQPATVSALQDKLQGVKVDLLVNNAGALVREKLEDLKFDTIQQQFEVNAIGPLRITHALLKNLEKGSKVVMITSRMGSVADNTSGGFYGYRMSKCALNMASVSLARDLEPSGVAVGLVHPGYVKTDLTGGHGDLTPEESVSNILKRADELTIGNTGTFWHCNGTVLPW